MQRTETLRDVRMRNGITQTELGKLLGVRATAISKYERGEREPDFEKLFKMANIFGLTMDELLEVMWASKAPQADGRKERRRWREIRKRA